MAQALSTRSEQFRLAGSDSLHTHLALAGSVSSIIIIVIVIIVMAQAAGASHVMSCSLQSPGLGAIGGMSPAT